jgi:hypothetical protein
MMQRLPAHGAVILDFQEGTEKASAAAVRTTVEKSAQHRGADPPMFALLVHA